jgi:hypothetical protein
MIGASRERIAATRRSISLPLAAGQRRVEVIGPLLEDEAAAVHAGAWDTG